MGPLILDVIIAVIGGHKGSPLPPREISRQHDSKDQVQFFHQTARSSFADTSNQLLMLHSRPITETNNGVIYILSFYIYFLTYDI